MKKVRLSIRPYGLTLVEILTALFVLVIGISGTLAIVIRSQAMGTAATDRNNASILIPEAIEDIKRMHLIDSNTANLLGNASLTGEFMDTLNMNGSNPFNNVMIPYFDAAIGKTSNCTYGKLAYPPNNSSANLMYWPINLSYSRVMGQFPQVNGKGVDPTLGNTGSAYRALYRLEPHPDWILDRMENLQSAFAGVYVLTLTMYKDLDPIIWTNGYDPINRTSNKTKRLQQISDPVVVFIRDSKARN